MDNVKKRIKMRFDDDPSLYIKKALLNLLPYVGHMSKKIGRRVHIAPVFLKPNKRYVLMINWLIKSQKNKTNILGIKAKDVVNNIVNSFYKKGEAYKLRKLYIKKSLDSRYILLQKNRFSKFRSRALVKNARMDIASGFVKSKKLELSFDDMNKLRIRNFMKSLLFLKYKNKKYRKSIRHFKKLLFTN